MAEAITHGEFTLRMPKEATCDVECAMKVESLRILNKKRKQQQRTDTSGAGTSCPSGAGNGRGLKRSFPGSPGTEPQLGKGNSEPPLDCDAVCGGNAPDNSKSSLINRGNSKDSKDSARRRFVWSVPLHQDFVAAVFDIGLKCASPKLLLEMMPVVDGLTSEHIKSHLQKYRLHRQRSREEFLKSYGYLTDLDGAKGLGGGTAAAAIKAAAAAVSEAKGGVPRTFSDPASESHEGGCDMKCECHNSASSLPETATEDATLAIGVVTPLECDREVEVPPKISNTGESGGAVEAEDVAVARSETSGGSDERPAHNDHGGDKDAERSPGSTQASRAEAGANQPTQPIHTGNVHVMTGALVQSHLELLSKGINMQIRFHHHLHQVVESQRKLQAELLAGQRDHLPPILSEPGSPRVITSAADTLIPATIGPSPIDHPLGGLRQAECSPRDRNMSGAARFLGADGGLPNDSVFDLNVPRSVWEIPGAAKMVSSPTSLAEAIAEANGLVGVSSAASSQSMKQSSPPLHASDSTLDSAAPGSAHASGDAPRDIAPPVDLRYKSRTPDVAPMSHFNPAAVPPARNRSKMSSPRVGMPRRGYVPGEYTLRYRVSGAVAAGDQPHIRRSAEVVGQRAGDHSGMAAAQCGAEARGALAAATGLTVSATPIGTPEREALALKRQMQTQLEMHRTVVGACTGQANGGGAERFPVASRVFPALAEVGGGNSGNNARIEAMGARINSGAGGEVAGTMIGEACRLGVSGAGGGNYHPQESVEASTLLGLLQDSDILDLNWLDRSDLKSVDQGPTSARQAGEEQPSLLSLFME